MQEINWYSLLFNKIYDVCYKYKKQNKDQIQSFLTG